MGREDKAERYAGALFGLVEEDSFRQKTADQLEHIIELLTVLPLFRKILFAPVFPKQQKKTLLLSLLKHVDAPHLLALLVLLLERGSIRCLPEIVRGYRALLLKKEGVVKVQLETALSISLEAENRIKDFLKKRLGKDLLLEKKVSPSLIGGVRLSLPGRSLNNAIRDKLSYLKTRFAHEL